MYTYALYLARQAVICHMSKHSACVNQLVSNYRWITTLH